MGLPWWLLGFGTFFFWIFRLKDKGFLPNARLYVFVVYIIGCIGGFFWLAMEDAEGLSMGTLLRFTSLQNLWLGLKAEPVSLFVFPAVSLGVLEAVYRSYRGIMRRVAEKGLRQTVFDFYFSDD